MKKLTILLLAISSYANGQITTCGFNPNQEITIDQPKSIETDCRTIRVVVHVIYDGLTGLGDISREQVLSQIRIAQQWFRNDSIMYDESNTPLTYNIELARFDPLGNQADPIIYYDGYTLFGQDWSTFGLRTSDNTTTSASVISNLLSWGTDINGKRYMNCYVVPKINGSNQSGVQAFAYFPTSLPIYGNYNLSNTFGAEQLETEYMQDFDLKTITSQGKTFIHELGHNFGLYHTFDNTPDCEETYCEYEGDRVCDTPVQQLFTGAGCVTGCEVYDENVMGYKPQSCKVLLTQGQVDRAVSVIENSLSNYLVCEETCIFQCKGDINSDGLINSIDFTLFAGSFGSSENTPQYIPNADLNCDGVVNSLDFAIFSTVFGTFCSGEPISIQYEWFKYIDTESIDGWKKRRK